MNRVMVVASLNPIKIQAVRDGLEVVGYPGQYSVEGIEAHSGVSDQPMDDNEATIGAHNRAHQAWKESASRSWGTDLYYGVGIEGGMQEVGGRWYDKGWFAIRTNIGVFTASTINMEVPAPVLKLVQGGLELGHACDEYFGTTNSKQDTGHFGLMTGNRITRQSAYRDAFVAAWGAYLMELER